MNTETYNLINFIVQTIIGIAIISTFIVYYCQLMAMRNASKGQNTISIINILQDSEVRKARKIVIKDLSTKEYATWTDEEKDSASIVCSNYDILSILIAKQGFVENKLFLDNWGPSIIKCYNILKCHIEEMQKPQNSGSNYWNDFKLLYGKCKTIHGNIIDSEHKTINATNRQQTP
jgi:hypothetical protein